MALGYHYSLKIPWKNSLETQQKTAVGGFLLAPRLHRQFFEAAPLTLAGKGNSRLINLFEPAQNEAPKSYGAKP